MLNYSKCFIFVAEAPVPAEEGPYISSYLTVAEDMENKIESEKNDREEEKVEEKEEKVEERRRVTDLVFNVKSNLLRWDDGSSPLPVVDLKLFTRQNLTPRNKLFKVKFNRKDFLKGKNFFRLFV